MHEAATDQENRYSRAQGALLGLAFGDAITHSSMQRTRFATPMWMERILGRILANDRANNIDRFVVPFIMNRDPDVLLMSPSSRSEWAAFSAQLLIEADGELSLGFVGDYWVRHILPNKDNVRSGIAERSAILNLSKGLQPPMSGNDNPHFYDDGAISRAVVVGIRFSRDPDKAAQNSRIEAMVSHKEDGVWAAMAMASAIACLVDGGSCTEAVDWAIRYFPQGSWIKQQWDLVCTVDLKQDPLDLLLELDNSVVDKTYSYANLAPQTLPIALFLFKKMSDSFRQGIALANCLARVSDSVVPFVGALLGAKNGAKVISGNWKSRLSPLRGTFVPKVAGADLADLATRLMEGD
ncbi:MAG TPA: ADP-ribosylglycohydrolase family protein [Firmicutes bacterium]|nr:ADP-ribosylglycohydrolase family protein [Bacillota bacterium]